MVQIILKHTTMNLTNLKTNNQCRYISYRTISHLFNSKAMIWNKLSIAFIVLSLFAGVSAMAQTSHKVSGKLLALNNNQPVEFATVSLYNLSDSSLVTGVISDNAGNFAINGIAKGNYYLKVSYMGYKPMIRNNVSLSDAAPEYIAGDIALEEDVKAIKEVTIEGERLKGTTEVDKIVYAVTPKASSIAHSGLELLRQVPAVQVDFQNNLTLEGSSNVMILVDGKQRDKDYLAQLDPSLVDKVEVMTNPSAKYDASIDGVINIILKKNNRLGYSARIEAEIPLGNRFSNSSANFDMGLGPLRVYASAYLHAERFDLYNDLNRNSAAIRLSTKGAGTGEWTYMGINYGLDYTLDKNNTLSLYANYRPKTGSSRESLDANEILKNGTFLSFDSAYSKNHDKTTSQYYSLFYKHNFAKPSQELTLDLNYNFYTANTDNFYSIQYFSQDKTTYLGNKIGRTERIRNDKDAFGVKLDYSQPLSDKTKLYIGYNGYFQKFNNVFITESDVTPENFNYTEARHAFYGSLSGSVQSFTWQTGLRYELSAIEINDATNIQYDCFLPNISLQQKLSKTKTLKLNYRRSIQRPSIYDLNPFVNRIDSITTSHGNPALDPSYSNKVELNFSMQLGSSFITPGVYYTYYTNNFYRITAVNADGTSENFTENIGNGFEYGFNFSGSVKISKKIQFNPYFAVFSKNYAAVDPYGIKKADKISYRTNFTIITNITEKLLFFTYFQYNSPYISSQKTTKRDPIYVFGLERNLFKNNKGKVSLTVINPFMKRFSVDNSITESVGYFQEQDIQVDVQPLMTVKFSYSFNKGQELKKIDRKREAESDGKNSLF